MFKLLVLRDVQPKNSQDIEEHIPFSQNASFPEQKRSLGTF